MREIRTLRAMWRALETGATAIPKRARRWETPDTAKELPPGHRASARPYQARVRNSSRRQLKAGVASTGCAGSV